MYNNAFLAIILPLSIMSGTSKENLGTQPASNFVTTVAHNALVMMGVSHHQAVPIRKLNYDQNAIDESVDGVTTTQGIWIKHGPRPKFDDNYLELTTVHESAHFALGHAQRAEAMRNHLDSVAAACESGVSLASLLIGGCAAERFCAKKIIKISLSQRCGVFGLGGLLGLVGMYPLIYPLAGNAYHVYADYQRKMIDYEKIEKEADMLAFSVLKQQGKLPLLRTILNRCTTKEPLSPQRPRIPATLHCKHITDYLDALDKQQKNYKE